MKHIKHIPLQLILFIFFFGCLTLFVNSSEQHAYHFFRNGIRAIVETGHIYIDKYLPVRFNGDDAFDFEDGHRYLNKQPGVFFIGAVVYFFLYKAGITYEKNTALAGSLVTLFTSVIMTSLMGVFLFNIVFALTKSKIYSVITAVFFVFGTLIFPYSGIPHHDIFGTFFVFTGFYLLFYRYRISEKKSYPLIILAAFCTGFALFNSLNTVTLIVLCTIYIFCYRNKKDISLFVYVLIVSLLPTFIFNYLVFGDPFFFTGANEDYKGPVPRLSAENTLAKINMYLFSPRYAIPFYSPIFVVSLFGFLSFPRKYLIEMIVLPLAFVLLLCQLVNVGSVGGLQFGTRYLLESMPFVLIGLSGFFTKEKGIWGITLNKYKYLMPVVILLGIVSVVICSTGSIVGTMYNHFDQRHPFIPYLNMILSGELPSFPLFSLGVVCILISVLLLFVNLSRQ